jgi:hypothetical protein
MLTDRGSEYCGNPERHEYELYLAVEDIDHCVSACNFWALIDNPGNASPSQSLTFATIGMFDAVAIMFVVMG